MKKGLLGVGFFLIIIINLAFILAIPYPNGFTGNINVLDGKNPNGETLIGKINGVATGSSLISQGKFNIVITSENGLSGTIKFYIGNESANEIFSYKAYDITHTNLTFNTVPTFPGICGNGICEQNECSICPIDCKVSECLGNGVCDTQIGETCSNSPQDCGSCPVPSGGGGGGNSNGGGGSSEGGGSSGDGGSGGNNGGGNVVAPTGNSPLGVQNLTNIAKEQNANWISLTGSAILDFTKSGEGILTFSGLITILFVLILFFIIRKKRVNKKIQEKSPQNA